MAEVGIDIVAFNVEYEDGFLESLMEEMGDDYKPVIFHIDSDHAQYIEFGSQGRSNTEFKKRSKTGKGKASKRSDVYDKIRAWVVARGVNGTEKDVDSIAFAIFRKIITEGIPPQPFIRPALHEIERKLEDGDFSGEGNTMETVAIAFRDKMKKYLEENHTIYPGGSIADSIYWEHVDFDDPRLDGNSLFNGIDIPENVWEDNYAELNGNRERAIEREISRGRLRW